MINYKNFFYSLILFLPLSFSNANAGYGSGELKLSDNVIYSFTPRGRTTGHFPNAHGRLRACWNASAP